MGAKVPCESKWCTKEVKVVCKCSFIKLCLSCYEKHLERLPDINHDTVRYRDQTMVEEKPPNRFSISGIVFLRCLYYSSEHTTEVHEGEIEGLGKVAVKTMFCRTLAELRKRENEAAI